MHKQKRKETLTALSTQIMVSDTITDREKKTFYSLYLKGYYLYTLITHNKFYQVLFHAYEVVFLEFDIRYTGN